MDMNTELNKFNETIAGLESGEIRVAEKVNGEWKVNSWVKETILSGFRLGKLTDMSQGQFSFFDKDTIPARTFTAENGVRIVPGGSSVRKGAYLAPSVIMMPPAYVNIGAYVDEGTMIDSHALVGIAGEAAHQRDGQQGIHAQGQDQIEELVAHEHGKHTQHQTHDQQCHIQTVVTITTHHKALDSACKIHAGLTQPAAYLFHWDHLFAKIVCLLYGFFPRLQRVSRNVHRRFGFRSQMLLKNS